VELRLDFLEFLHLLFQCFYLFFEHPFGTLKEWMGATHFLTRKLAGVSAEMSLTRPMRPATLTLLSLSQRTSMIQDDEAMSVFTHSGPEAAG
jgi:hypothetical protein